MVHTRNEFQPDYIVSPGEILEEVLASKSIKKIEFAERCGRSPKAISQIISGIAPITPELAIRFHRVLGSSPVLWNNLEANYRLQLASKAEREELQKRAEWAKEFPVNELVKRGFFEKPASDIDLVAKVLDFFGVGNVAAWEEVHTRVRLSFRHSPSFTSDPKTLAAWLRIGTIKAEQIVTKPYNEEKFRSALNVIRATTDQGPEAFEPVIKEECAEAGVAVVFEPEFKNISLSGITRWLNKNKALIMMTLRHKSDDHFWFTFFHEATHVLLHNKKGIFVDGIQPDSQDDKLEEEANRFAANFLIPVPDYFEFIQRGDFSKRGIKRFARTIGIAPGIVVGRLQKDHKILYGWHNDLKRRFKFVEHSN